MQDSTNNTNQTEENKYYILGYKLGRTSDNDLMLLKWIEEYLQQYGYLDNKEYTKNFIGLLGTIVFIINDYNKISSYDEFLKYVNEINLFYANNINNIQDNYPFRLNDTDKHLLLIKKYKIEILETLNIV